MLTLPVQAVGALAAAAPLAEAAVTGATESFAHLLKAVTSPAKKTTPEPGALAAIGLDGPGGVSTADSPTSKLRGQTKSLLKTFHQLLTQLMPDHDFTADGDLRIQTGASGNLQVAGRESESLRIQELARSHPELQQLFERIVANVSLLRLAEETGSAMSPVSLIVDATQANVGTD